MIRNISFQRRGTWVAHLSRIRHPDDVRATSQFDSVLRRGFHCLKVTVSIRTSAVIRYFVHPPLVPAT